MSIRWFKAVIPILCLMATVPVSAQDGSQDGSTFIVGRGGTDYERGTISTDDFQVMIYRRLQQVVTEMIHDDVRGTLATTSAAVRIVLEDSLLGISSLRGRQLVDRLVADSIILDMTATEAALRAQGLFCDGITPRGEVEVAEGIAHLRRSAAALIGNLPSGGSALSTVAIDDDSFHQEISGWFERNEGTRACPARNVWERLVTTEGTDMQVKWLLVDCVFLQLIDVLYRLDDSAYYQPVASVAGWLRANWGLDLATVRATLEVQLGSQLEHVVNHMGYDMTPYGNTGEQGDGRLNTLGSIGPSPTIYDTDRNPDSDADGTLGEDTILEYECPPGDLTCGVFYDPSDYDADGIVEDYCPRSPEDLDDFEDADGCPDPDHRHPLSCSYIVTMVPGFAFLCETEVQLAVRRYFVRMAEQGNLAGISVNPEVSRLLGALAEFPNFASVDMNGVTVDIDAYVLHFYEKNNVGAVWQLYLGLGATMGPVHLFGGNTDAIDDEFVYPLVYSEKIGIKLNSFRSDNVNIHHTLFVGGLLYSLTTSLADDSNNPLSHTAIVGLDVIGVRLWNSVELNLEATLFAPLSGDGTFGAGGGINLALPLVDYFQSL